MRFLVWIISILVFFQELFQSGHFPRMIGKSRKDQIIERYPYLVLLCDRNRLADIIKRITFRAIIGGIKTGLRRIHADSHAVETGETESVQLLLANLHWC